MTWAFTSAGAAHVAAVKGMARKALTRAAERAPATGVAPRLIVEEPPPPCFERPASQPPRDPFEAIEVVEEALECILPTASFRWQVQGDSVVLIADLGATCLEVSPMTGDRLRVRARSVAGGPAPCEIDPME